jgi:hypothetical protein
MNIISHIEHPDIEKAVETKLQDFKSSPDFQSMIQSEVMKAFEKAQTLEDDITNLEDAIPYYGQAIFDTVFGIHDIGGSNESFFINNGELPTIDDFDGRVTKEQWRKVTSHPDWVKIVRLMKYLTECRAEEIKLRGREYVGPRHTFLEEEERKDEEFKRMIMADLKADMVKRQQAEKPKSS